MAKLFAFSNVNNEEDIVEQSITWALQWCEKVIIIDTGSVDDTVEIIRAMAARDSRIEVESHPQPFQEHTRLARQYNKYHTKLAADDWWLKLDADEFLFEDPREFIARANEEQADFIYSYVVQFYYTDQDLADWRAGHESVLSRAQPIQERRKHYKIDWIENRFCRNVPDQPWIPKPGSSWPPGLASQRICSGLILNGHYPYRDPIQMQVRLLTRMLTRLQSPRTFRHLADLTNWRQSLAPAEGLCYNAGDGQWDFRYFDEAILPWNRSVAPEGPLKRTVKKLLRWPT